MIGARHVKRQISIDEKENEDEGEVIKKKLKAEPQILRTPPRPPLNQKFLSPNSKWIEVQARLKSPSFSKKIQQRTTELLRPDIDPTARDKESRCRMHAKDDCPCCRPYFDSLGLSEDETKKRIQAVGKHRAVHHYDKTPPRYWDLEIRSSPSPKRFSSQAGVKKRRK